MNFEERIPDVWGDEGPGSGAATTTATSVTPTNGSSPLVTSSAGHLHHTNDNNSIEEKSLININSNINDSAAAAADDVGTNVTRGDDIEEGEEKEDFLSREVEDGIVSRGSLLLERDADDADIMTGRSVEEQPSTPAAASSSKTTIRFTESEKKALGKGMVEDSINVIDDPDFVVRRSPYGHLISTYHVSIIKNHGDPERMKRRELLVPGTPFVKDRPRTVLLQRLPQNLPTRDLYEAIIALTGFVPLRIDRPKMLHHYWTHTYALAMFDSTDIVPQFIAKVKRDGFKIGKESVTASPDIAPKTERPAPSLAPSRRGRGNSPFEEDGGGGHPYPRRLKPDCYHPMKEKSWEDRTPEEPRPPARRPFHHEPSFAPSPPPATTMYRREPIQDYSYQQEHHYGSSYNHHHHQQQQHHYYAEQELQHRYEAYPPRRPLPHHEERSYNQSHQYQYEHQQEMRGYSTGGEMYDDYRMMRGGGGGRADYGDDYDSRRGYSSSSSSVAPSSRGGGGSFRGAPAAAMERGYGSSGGNSFEDRGGKRGDIRNLCDARDQFEARDFRSSNTTTTGSSSTRRYSPERSSNSSQQPPVNYSSYRGGSFKKPFAADSEASRRNHDIYRP